MHRLQELQRLSSRVPPPPAPPPPPLAARLCDAAALLAAVTSWDFERGAEPQPEGQDDSGENRAGLNATCVKPPVDSGWVGVLGRTELLDCVSRLYASTAGWPSGDAATAARHVLRQLLVQLASVSRRLFTAETHPPYLNALLHTAAHPLRGAHTDSKVRMHTAPAPAPAPGAPVAK